MNWDFYNYPKSSPRKVRGGIKAQTQRGAFGQSWWAKRWIAVLESFNIASRLQRGRSYARGGQVLSLDIEAGRVRAQVQGSRATPYQVEIGVATLNAGAEVKLAAELNTQMLLVSTLLAGEMPDDIEQAFAAAGLSLFPQRGADLQTSCSCPDYSNPCKHIAAVYYLMGEEFNRDPFLIFRLRGISRDRLLNLLHSGGGPRNPESSTKESEVARPAGKRRKKTPAQQSAKSEGTKPEPMATGQTEFWHGKALPDGFFGEVGEPPVAAPLIKHLGSFPLWRGDQPFNDAMQSIYRHASSHGLEVFVGENAEAEEPAPLGQERTKLRPVAGAGASTKPKRGRPRKPLKKL